MFSIKIDMACSQIEGFEAIDLCRRFGLAERPSLGFGSFDSRSATVATDEAFARTHFGNELSAKAVVHLRDLCPGEVVDLPPQSEGRTFGYIALNAPAFTPERAKELFFRSRIMAAEEKRTQLISQLKRREEDLALARKECGQLREENSRLGRSLADSEAARLEMESENTSLRQTVDEVRSLVG